MERNRIPTIVAVGICVATLVMNRQSLLAPMFVERDTIVPVKSSFEDSTKSPFYNTALVGLPSPDVVAMGDVVRERSTIQLVQYAEEVVVSDSTPEEEPVAEKSVAASRSAETSEAASETSEPAAEDEPMRLSIVFGPTSAHVKQMLHEQQAERNDSSAVRFASRKPMPPRRLRTETLGLTLLSFPKLRVTMRWK